MSAAKQKTVKVHAVTGPLATPYLETGERIYLYQGAVLPGGLREGEVERLTDLGLVSEVEIDAESAPADEDKGES